jgi:hypothetical protein
MFMAVSPYRSAAPGLGVLQGITDMRGAAKKDFLSGLGGF